MSKINRPFNVIDPDTNKEIVIWDSRSVAVAGFVFAQNKRGKWFVLANKRGEGCPDYQGYWCCPCGYLDWGEDAKQALSREVWEETGLSVSKNMFNHIYTDSNPISNRENVTIFHYAILDGTVDEWSNFNTDHMEPNEVADIKWIPIEQINRYNWAFGHAGLIFNVFTRFIEIPWYKKLVLKYYNKWFNYAA